MSGFLGILDTPVPTIHLEKLAREVDALSTKPFPDSGLPKVDGSMVGWDAQSSISVYNRAFPTPRVMPERHAASGMSASVAAVVMKVEALMELIDATTKSCYRETKMDDCPLSLDIQSEGGTKTK
jgi:hypothetical protein